MKQIAALICAYCCLIAAACTGKENIQQNMPAGTITLRQAGGDFGYPNPFRHRNRGPGFFKMELIYDSLLEKDEKGLIPWLAKEWTVGKDGKTYTFTLTDKIVWHDGKPLTAEDVVFTISYYKEHPSVRGGLMLNGKYLIESASADGNKVTITISEYTPTALEKLGSMRIIPKHIWENVSDPEKFSGEGDVIGSGPYRLTSYNKEQGSYKMEKFDNFWGLEPAVAAIEWLPVANSVLAFDNNEIDITKISPDLLTKYKSNNEFKIIKSFGFHSYRLYFNFEKVPQLRKKEVRQAIAHAIDRTELIEKIERGAGIEISQGYLPPMHALYNKNVISYSFNPEVGKKLMNGQNFSLQLLIGNNPKEAKIAELLKIRLQEIGIILNVISIDSKARDGKIKDKDYEIALIHSGGMGGDADMLREIYSSKVKRPFLAGYSNTELDELLHRQSVEMDAEKRKTLVFKIQEILAEEIPMLLLYGDIDYTIYRPAAYDGWMARYDHTKVDHPKLSYVKRK